MIGYLFAPCDDFFGFVPFTFDI
jgi:hypothetical protein